MAAAFEMSNLKLGRTKSGHVVRIEGRGTMRESRMFHEFAADCLENGPCTLTADLSSCEYLDSTFLGCLLDLNKRYASNDRFSIAASSQHCHKLLGATRLDKILNIKDQVPAVIGPYVPIPKAAFDARELGHHVLECHRQLAQIEGPEQAVFAELVKRLAGELQAKQSAGGPGA